MSLEATELLSDVQHTLDVAECTVDRSSYPCHPIRPWLQAKQTRCQIQHAQWWLVFSVLACSCTSPDLLILDEPTNYLDITSVLWLQNYLNSFASTPLVVAHDHEFIDAIAREIITLRNKTLTYFDGNLTEYERHTRAERAGKNRMKEAMDKKRSAIEKSIGRVPRRREMKIGREWSSRGKRSWSTMEPSAKGTRFQLNRDLAGFILPRRAGLTD